MACKDHNQVTDLKEIYKQATQEMFNPNVGEMVGNEGEFLNTRLENYREFVDQLKVLFEEAKLAENDAFGRERRYEQLLKSGSKPSFKNIRKSLVDRDEKDINREISPLKAAKEAVIIESSKLNIESILDKILELYKISGV